MKDSWQAGVPGRDDMPNRPSLEHRTGFLSFTHAFIVTALDLSRAVEVDLQDVIHGDPHTAAHDYQPLVLVNFSDLTRLSQIRAPVLPLVRLEVGDGGLRFFVYSFHKELEFHIQCRQGLLIQLDPLIRQTPGFSDGGVISGQRGERSKLCRTVRHWHLRTRPGDVVWEIHNGIVFTVRVHLQSLSQTNWNFQISLCK